MTTVKLVLAAVLMTTSFNGILAAVSKERANAQHVTSRGPHLKDLRQAGIPKGVDSSALAASIQREKDLLANLSKTLDRYKAVSGRAETASAAKEKADNDSAEVERQIAEARAAVDEAKQARVTITQLDLKSNPYDAIKSSHKDLADAAKKVADATETLAKASKRTESAKAAVEKAADEAARISEEKALLVKEMYAQRREAKLIAKDISKLKAQQTRQQQKFAKAAAGQELEGAKMLAAAEEIAHDRALHSSGGKRQHGKLNAAEKGDASKDK